MAYSRREFVLEILELEPVLKAFLSRFTRQPADVEDLVQETYGRLLSLDDEQLRQVKSTRQFALTVARNLALDMLRRRQVIPIDLVADMAALNVFDEQGLVEDLVSAQQELLALERAVARLPSRCRAVFILRKVYGHSQKEISQRLSISEHTVERHLVKALKRIRSQLAGRRAAGREAIPSSATGNRRGLRFLLRRSDQV
jgi:RNA polymerase sigma factor (sigma-70 family)